jgi:putative Holliday junction resolvase
MTEITDTNYLGLDWGESKVGVALAHAETEVAVAYGIFKNNEDLLEELERLVKNETIGTVVVGIPKRKESPEEHPAKKFGQNIANILGVKVVYTNEMFTTKLAKDTLKVLGKKQLGAQDDSEAAKILLQDWLDREVL